MQKQIPKVENAEHRKVISEILDWRGNARAQIGSRPTSLDSYTELFVSKFSDF